MEDLRKQLLDEAISNGWVFKSLFDLLNKEFKGEGEIIKEGSKFFHINNEVKTQLDIYYCKNCGYVKGKPDIELGNKYCNVCQGLIPFDGKL